MSVAGVGSFKGSTKSGDGVFYNIK